MRGQPRAQAVDPVFDYTTERAIRIADAQLRVYERLVAPIDRAFDPETTPEERTTLLEEAIDGLTAPVRATLVGLTDERWAAVRGEAARVLETTERDELRDTAVEPAKAALSAQDGGRAER